MLFQCFLDDSKDKTQNQVYISAGFIGLEEDWRALSIFWRDVLFRNHIKYFKSSECNRLDGQFQRFRSDDYPRPCGREAAKKIRDDLLAVARCFHKICGVGVAIPIPIYRNVCERPEAKSFFEADPYRRALEGVLNETMKQVETFPGDHAVFFIHDEQQDWRDLEHYYHEYKGKNPRHAKAMAGFIPMDDKTNPPLQLADALANQSVRYGVDWLRNPQAALQEQDDFNICKLGIWDERIMLHILKLNLENRSDKPSNDFLERLSRLEDPKFSQRSMSLPSEVLILLG